MQKREEMIAKMKNNLDELDAKIAVLEARYDQEKHEQKAELEKKISDIKSKRNDLKEKISNAKESSEEAWKELSEGFEKSYEQISDSIKNAVSKF